VRERGEKRDHKEIQGQLNHTLDVDTLHQSLHFSHSNPLANAANSSEVNCFSAESVIVE
jgi:hypothetical protein